MSEKTGIYMIPVFNYVTGRFNPANHPLFINLDKTDIPVSRKGQYLRKETAESLSLMLRDFKKDNPKIKISVISATRNFISQKTIWEEKWTGKRKISGAPSISEIKDPAKKGELILQYSSMPGTSRHHWGTDFDINQLNNEYYTKGEGKAIYNWLVNNAAKYGFYQPYTTGRDAGYKEEKWHWSYLPLSKIFISDWNNHYNSMKSNFWKELPFKGVEYVGHLAPVYVNSINSECK
jgi:LAS superfamily LD-carboxypeptidase LdcB